MTDERLVSLRRELHTHPEPAWCEFYTTARIVEELEALDVDEVHVGPDAIAAEHRMGVPDDDERSKWLERARDAGADERLLERLDGGCTGIVAVLRRGSGPAVGLRVDIDGLPRTEANDSEHAPAAEGFRSRFDETMHACGHDAHAAIGVGVIEEIRESDFEGTLVVFFQPAEEALGGGKSMAKSDHLRDIEYLLATHVGLEHPTGEVVAGVDGFFAVRHFDVRFTGESAHAGARPEDGTNANQALATAVGNLHAIPRHSGGVTRVNAGVIEGGSAANVIAEQSRLVAEIRGETSELLEFVDGRARRVFENAGSVHGCDVDIETVAEAPSTTSDGELAALVAQSARDGESVENVRDRREIAGSEDATYLMREVQENGGRACYVGIGTDHPGGHHTSRFDVDEESIGIGVDVLSGTIERISDGALDAASVADAGERTDSGSGPN